MEKVITKSTYQAVIGPCTIINDKGSQTVCLIGINNLIHKPLTQIKLIVEHFRILFRSSVFPFGSSMI